MASRLPHSERVEPGSVNLPARPYPPSVRTTSVDAGKVAAEAIATFNAALQSGDFKKLSELFVTDGYWRDHLCLSWDLRTLKGRDKIQTMLSNKCRLTEVRVDTSTDFRAPHLAALDAHGKVQCLQYFIKAETEVGTGEGVVRMIESGDGWEILTFFTTLRELKNHEEPLRHRREKGVEHTGNREAKNWKEKREDSVNYTDSEPTVVIIGAGQAGLTVAARLKMLNINALVVDKHGKVGDSWRKRYHQLVLHDPVWYDHLPYISFPAHWPVFTPKDKMADFFEAYASLLELNVWTSTTLTGSTWSDARRQWTLTLDRTRPDGSRETRTLRPRHVIQATGHSGKMFLPDIEGMGSFAGDRLCHSSEFPGAKPGSRGKKAVVMGSCNSGHDIAQDFYERGYSVTMVQRSSTCVVSSASITDIGLRGLYDETSAPVDDADLWLWSLPAELFKALQVGTTERQNAHDAALLDGLRRAGFRLDTGPGGGGFFVKYFQRGGGYYIDVGCSRLVVDGAIAIKQGQEVVEVLPRGLRFADGTELEADEIVFATGYQNMRTEARGIFGDEVADRVGDVWGFDDEGEFRTMWRRSGHPGFWFMGGNLALCRYFSKILALQIKAVEEGIDQREASTARL
ncbi:putative indole-3-pyruvate monooxygenase YUCCA1 [Colletotrichum orbiculare MAFF 240422]|uniref:Indole-3-pyruvate monooxygenase YUCCA1 n=1 Tax=Colletotrichum orbiculare (strain 104-T / ATCC 96160 / CBS 514.97 / LARS 414 / MAFF 240422) TaxID=1213857 RepID=N4VXD3_COLOR|nr:putative indole-3-pyruvate monooxygenase YUCCA1 [Colletotrichum orbiculare MAFF 240422]